MGDLIVIRKWLITQPTGTPKGCLLVLPGRSVPCQAIDGFVHHCGLCETIRIVLEPFNCEWYPAPHGVDDQEDAVAGCKEAVVELENTIKKIQAMYNLSRKEIAFMGYSAGAVMAVQLAMQPGFAGAVAIAGAILDTEDLLPAVEPKTPILLRHNRDDMCFDWHERYLPMRDALEERGYDISVNEGHDGGHGVKLEDAHLSGNFLAPFLGYTEPLGFPMLKHEEDDEDD